MIKERAYIEGLSRGVLRSKGRISSKDSRLQQQMDVKSMALPAGRHDESVSQVTQVTPRDYRPAFTVCSQAGATVVNSLEDFTEQHIVALTGDEKYNSQGDRHPSGGAGAEGRNDTETTMTIKLDDLLNESSSALKIDTTSWLKHESEAYPSSTRSNIEVKTDILNQSSIIFPDQGAMVQANVQLFQNFPAPTKQNCSVR